LIYIKFDRVEPSISVKHVDSRSFIYKDPGVKPLPQPNKKRRGFSQVLQLHLQSCSGWTRMRQWKADQYVFVCIIEETSNVVKEWIGNPFGFWGPLLLRLIYGYFGLAPRALAGMYDIIYVCPKTLLRIIWSLQKLEESRGITLFAIDKVPEKWKRWVGSTTW